MNAFVEFIPRHFEKALDIGRHLASYAKLDFTAESVRMTLMDPAKAMYMETCLFPAIYKTDKEFSFGVNLNMIYKLVRSLDNNLPVEIEASPEKMTIIQIGHRHELTNQTLQYDVPKIESSRGPVVKLSTKVFQKYVRTLGNVSPVFEISYDSGSLFLESVNSMYRTLFSIDVSDSNNEAWPELYKQQFVTKFVDSAINPSMGDEISLELGTFLQVRYAQEALQTTITIANYTEG